MTAITGFEKGSGKTTFLTHALPLVRKAGPVAVFSIGVDGALKARDAGAPSPEIRVERGDLVLTTEAFARGSSASFEVLEALPGRSALGRLFLGRALRGGSVTLVGSEHLSVLADLIAQVRREGWAHSVLVDGAVNRVTQVAALGDLAFVFTARLDRANLARAAARIRHLNLLASLPVEPQPQEGALRIEGPLGPAQLSALPQDTRIVSIEDFTKVFLEPADLSRALQRLDIRVRRAFRLLCVAVTLRDVSRPECLQAVGEAASGALLFNPYEVAS
ncbi:hypothetical protein GETHLI_13560 [Geothrix limicola]|uniref:Uncharacterized protein n=1 Tax=Geothrix limicola TaxID=2927978 RepID=A0ABQ5QFN1_9BACT|nr:hypothetical protein [Geothrix limicola]GLH72854.1 hypothetical protein GETHLI_13560 [Geothrix limicola]